MAARLIGLAAPDAALPSTSGGTVNVARLRGASVVFCYPYTGRPGVADPPGWDAIPGAHGSTPQARSYGACHPAFAAKRVAVFGLSLDGPEWQAEFAARAGLPFPLLSDALLRFSETLGLERFSAGGRDFLVRTTMIVRDGVIEAAWNAEPLGDAARALAAC